MQTRVRAGCLLMSFAFFLDPREMVVTEVSFNPEVESVDAHEESAI